MGEAGVAAIGRHLDRIEDRAHRRRRDHRRVGVPILADNVLVAGFAPDHDDLVVLLHAPVVRVDEDLAEAAGECLVLFGVELLVAKEHDAVLVERPADFGDRRVVDVVADPDAADFGAARPGDRAHLDAAVAHPSCSLKIPCGNCCRSRPGASGQDAWLPISSIWSMRPAV